MVQKKKMALKTYVILIPFLASLLIFCSCGMLKELPKKEFTTGYYTKRIAGKDNSVYVAVTDTLVSVYNLRKESNVPAVDTSSRITYKQTSTGQPEKAALIKNSLDVDFLTIPLKVRFSQKYVPAQINANLNGAIYLGYRTDRYNIIYENDPLAKNSRKINHYGFSAGLFTGFGGTFISPTNTANQIEHEYDGIVWSKGFAGIIAIGNFSAGVAIGFDNLLDRNKNIWIYENRGWLGLALGLNLN